MALHVDFHSGVADDLGFACRLLRKAYVKGARVLVRAPSPRLARLDRELWTFAEREFLPHLRFAAPGMLPPQAARTPIWLVDGGLPADAPPVLINLGAELPDGWQGFDRIIEVLSTDPDEAQRGRVRWKAYRAAGVSLEHHEPAGG